MPKQTRGATGTRLLKILWFLAAGAPAFGAITVTLAPSTAPPQPVGTRVIWTATASDTEAGELDYRFRVKAPGGAFRIVRDFYRTPDFEWMSVEHEGEYEIEVTARNRVTHAQAVEAAAFEVTSRVTGGDPVVSSTPHQLVVLYSAPACPAGGYLRVRFGADPGLSAATPWKPCASGLSRNFLIAGLRASTPYRIFHELAAGGSVTRGPILDFTTPALPPGLPFSVSTPLVGPDLQSCLLEPVVLHCNVAFGQGPAAMPVATDLLGRVLWYYEPLATTEQIGTTIFRPFPGGRMMLAVNDAASPLRHQQILREIDLAGNPLRETNVERVSEQLAAVGHDPITSFHHDIIELPNGNLIALASVERLVEDIQGPGTVDVIGDMLVELDSELQVVWAWNAFDHLDLARLATLGETCVDGQSGCPPVALAPVANDWLHSNSVHYSQDGNLILSIRHQDWVIKIDYQNGAGSGAVLWRLGQGGDFTPVTNDPEIWFSHQHDAEFDIPGLPLLSLYDNSNLRFEANPAAQSRGQVFWLDEAQRLAYPVLNANLGAYSLALGSAERLCNGNYFFDSGIATLPPDLGAQSVEVTPAGAVNYVLETTGAAYRTFRMYSLYLP